MCPTQSPTSVATAASSSNTMYCAWQHPRNSCSANCRLDCQDCTDSNPLDANTRVRPHPPDPASCKRCAQSCCSLHPATSAQSHEHQWLCDRKGCAGTPLPLILPCRRSSMIPASAVLGAVATYRNEAISTFGNLLNISSSPLILPEEYWRLDVLQSVETMTQVVTESSAPPGFACLFADGACHQCVEMPCICHQMSRHLRATPSAPAANSGVSAIEITDVVTSAGAALGCRQ